MKVSTDTNRTRNFIDSTAKKPQFDLHYFEDIAPPSKISHKFKQFIATIL